MKKFNYIFAIICGSGIAVMWIILLINGKVPELKTEPYGITTHITAEMLLASALFVSGIMGLRGRKKAEKLILVAFGGLVYSVVNSSGYYIDNPNAGLTIMFGIILFVTIYAIWRSL